MNTDKFTYAGIKTAKYNEDGKLIDLLPKQNQDYAICGEDRIILCDGCSSSDDTDLGARLLALSASIADLYIGNIKNDDNINIRSDRIGKRIIDHTWNNKTGCILDTAFDATLLIASYYKNIVSVFIYGDGYVVHKNKFNTTTYQIKNSSNTPAYLSYHLDEERKANYLEMNTTNTLTRFTHSHDDNGEIGGINSKVYQDVFEPFTFKLNVQTGDEIYLMSDGIESFRYEIDENNSQINEELSQSRLGISNLIENEILNFKNRKGKFIQRRYNRLIKDLFQQGIHPYDDVTIVGMIT